MPKRRFTALILGLTCAVTLATPASAEVRFGKNVRIGGHDVSNQTFTRKRRGVFYIYNKTPPKPGCSWHNNGDGSKTKVCHLKRKPH
ncbi:MAG: hypothetical protein ABL907_20695 [Hyphomicrobium sp.]